MSTLAVNNLTTQTGSTITVASGKTLTQPGAVLQCTQVVNATHNSWNSASWAASSLVHTITPKFSTSKVLVQFTGVIRSYNTSGHDARTAWRIYRQVGSGSWAQLGTHQMTHRAYDYGGSGLIADIPMHMQYLDSPNTTSTIGYKLYLYKEAGTAGEWNPDGDDESYVTLWEIAQ